MEKREDRRGEAMFYAVYRLQNHQGGHARLSAGSFSYLSDFRYLSLSQSIMSAAFVLPFNLFVMFEQSNRYIHSNLLEDAKLHAWHDALHISS